MILPRVRMWRSLPCRSTVCYPHHPRAGAQARATLAARRATAKATCRHSPKRRLRGRQRQHPATAAGLLGLASGALPALDAAQATGCQALGKCASRRGLQHRCGACVTSPCCTGLAHIAQTQPPAVARGGCWPCLGVSLWMPEVGKEAKGASNNLEQLPIGNAATYSDTAAIITYSGRPSSQQPCSPAHNG